MSVIDKLLHGSIDMHVHHGPDVRQERRVNALQAARQAEEAGMRAIVLKSHDYPTAPLAYIISQVVPNVLVFGGLTLDMEAGGLNTHALEVAGKLGAKVVWMPTLTSANDMRKRKRNEEGITVFDEKGKLLPVIGELLHIIKNYQMVLATGHISVPEAFAVVDEARRQGLAKIVVTHPLLDTVGACLTLDEQRQMADKGAFIEHCFSITMPFGPRLDPMKILEAVRTVGAERCIMSTDLGQSHNPTPAEGMRMAIATMLKCGLTEKELEIMVKTNPAKLLGLD